jgi:hypothetical protein
MTTYRNLAIGVAVMSLIGLQRASAQETMPEPVPLNNVQAAATARFTLQEAKERARRARLAGGAWRQL